MTEGNGHVIDPNGDARRALQEAVAEHGPEVLSDAGVMENVCRDHLAGLPGESILIGDAARTNVPALLGDLIPQLGNYGAIQSAAATLAGEHSLDMAASLWVVREFARALGYIAPATGTAAAFPDSGPRPVPGSGPRSVPGSGPPPGAGPAEHPAGPGMATGAAEGSGAAAAAAAGAAGVPADEAGRGEGAGSEVAASGSGASSSGAGGPGSGGPGSGGPGSGGPGSGGPGSSSTGASGAGGVSATGAGGQAGAGGETIPRGVAASRAGQAGGDGSAARGSEPGYGAGPVSGGTGQASGSTGNRGPALGHPEATGQAGGGSGAPGPADGGPRTTGPAGGAEATGLVGGSPVSTGPMRDVPGVSGPAAGGAWGGASAPGGTGGGGTGGSGTGGGGTGGGGTGSGGTGGGGTGSGGGWGGAAPEGEPGFPLPLPAGRLPGRQAQRSALLNRNTVGIAAAIALIAGYLGVAAVAHLSPFPAKAVPTASVSQSSSPPASSASSPASSPDPSADPSPPSQREILLTKIPSAVGNAGECLNDGTSFGSTAVIQCQKLQGLAANTIRYYLYPNRTALASGLSSFLMAATFRKRGECTTNGNFSDFIVNCESDFTIKTPGMTGSIAEYVNRSANQEPVIVSTDNEQNVMAVLVGTNDGDLLRYWNQLKWVVTP